MTVPPSPASLLDLTTALTAAARHPAAERPHVLVAALLAAWPALDGAALYRRIGRQAVYLAGAGEVETPAEALPLDYSTVIGQAILEGQPETEPAAAPAEGLGVAVPLGDGETIFGALYVYAGDPKSLFGEARAALGVAAQVIALALESPPPQNDLLNQTQQSLGDLHAQYDSLRRIVLAGDVAEMLQTLVDFVGPGCLSADLSRYEDPHMMRSEAPDEICDLVHISGDDTYLSDQRQPFAEHSTRPLYATIAGGIPSVIPDISKVDALDAAQRAVFTERGIQALIVLPLVSERLIYGQVVIGGADGASLGLERVRAYQALADQIATALENHALIQQSVEALTELRQLYSMADAILNARDPQVMVEQVYPTLTYRPGQLSLHRYEHDDTGQLIQTETLVAIGEEGRLPLGEAAAGWDALLRGALGDRLSHDEPLIFGEDEAAPAPEALQPLGLSALAAYPLRDADGLVRYVLCAAYPVAHSFDEDERQMLATASRQMGQRLVNWQLLEDTRRQTVRLQEQYRITNSLYQTGRVLSSALERDDLLVRAAENLYNALNVDQVTIALFSNEGRTFALAAAYPDQDLEGRSFDLQDAATFDVLSRARSTYSSQDVANDPALESIRPLLQAQGVQSLLLVPLVVGDVLIGSIALTLRHAQYPFSSDEINVSEAIAAQLAVSLQNAQLYDELELRVDQRTAELNRSEENERRFREALAELLDISNAMSRLTTLDDLAREAVQSGLHRLGFDRMALWLLDETRTQMMGTFGTDKVGNLRDERGMNHDVPDFLQLEDVLKTRTRLKVWEDTDLQDEFGVVGRGWNVMALIWDGDDGLGWIAADNLTNQRPLEDYQREILRLYGALLGNHVANIQADKAIEAQRTFLRQVIDANPSLIFAKDYDGRFTLVNQAVAEVYNTTVEAMLGKTDADFNPNAEEVEVFLRNDRVVIDTGQPAFIPEETISDTHGRPLRWLQTIKVPLTGADGQARQVLGIATDITERVQLQRQIQESLARRRSEVQTATEVAQEIAAAPALDELFRRVVTLVKERFAYYHAQVFRTDPATGDQYTVEGYGAAGEAMKAAGHYIKLGTGVVGTAASNKQPVLVADVATSPTWLPNPHLPDSRGELAVPILLRGEVVGVLDVQSETPGRLSTEDTLLLQGLCGQIAIVIENRQLLHDQQEQLSLLRTLIDAIPDYIYVKDRQSRMVINNLAHAQGLFGALSPEEVVGKSDFDFFPAEAAERMFADEQVLMAKDEPLINLELPIQTPEGKTLWHLDTKVPLHDAAGEVTGLVGITRNITARKEAELESQRLLNELGRRTGQLQAAAEASRAASARLDMEALLNETVELIRREFNLYYAGVFLLDEAGEYAELHAGTGQAGRKMREIHHRLKVGGQSMIGTAIAERQARVALDVTQEERFHPNPHLPQTRSEMALPLISRGQVIGAMTIQSTQIAAFSEDDVTSLQVMTDQLANAIENARLFEQSQAALARTEALYRGGNRISRAVTMQEVLMALIESTALGELDRIAMLIFDQPWDEENPPTSLMVAASWESSGEESPMPPGATYPAAGYPLVKLLAQTHPVVAADVNADSRFGEDLRTYFAQTLQMRGLLALPLLVGSRSIGGLVAQARDELHISEDQVRQIASLADQAAAVVQTQRLFAQTQTALAETRSLYQVGQAINRLGDLEAIFQALTEVLNQQLGYAGAWIALANEQGTTLQGVAGAGVLMNDVVVHTSVPLESRLAHPMVQAHLRGEAVLSNDVAHDRLTADLPSPLRSEVGRLLAMPILVQGQSIGVITVTRPLETPELRPRDGELLAAVASQAAIAFQNARLLAATQQRAANEQELNRITGQMQSHLQISTLLNDVVNELGRSINARRARVRLTLPNQPDEAAQAMQSLANGAYGHNGSHPHDEEQQP